MANPPSRPSSTAPSSSRPLYLRPATLRSTSSTHSLPSLSQHLPNSPTPRSSSLSIIQQAFVPHIAVHASEDTNALARDKGFADFKSLLRPYGEMVSGRVTARDSQGLSMNFDEFGVRVCGLWDLLDDGSRPYGGNVQLGRQGQAGPEGGISAPGGGCLEEIERLVEYHIDKAEELIESQLAENESAGTTTGGTGGLYGTFLRRMLSRMPTSAHEAFTHPVACVIAISSRNTAPIETLRRLYESGAAVPIPLFINRDYLRYYVLVHDEDRDDLAKSLHLFDQMKKHFGLHCHLLRIRSAQSVISDDDAVEVPQCQWLSAAEELEDIRAKSQEEYSLSPRCIFNTDAIALRTLVREMVTQSILPFMERCVATWNDQVASRRRGLSGRFLSMSKRYFTSSSSTRPSSSSTYDPITQSYPPTSPEATMRKLADYSFMLRDYKLAYSIYDLLKTDYANDKAWKCHAGAHEMAALSLLLLPSQKPPTPATLDPLLDLACYSYLSRCEDSYSYLRCIVLAVELLTPSKLTADSAAKWCTKALDTPALGPLTSAVLTERVAECYTTLGGRRRRKHGLWEILAARKYLSLEKRGRAGLVLDEVLQGYVHGDWEGLRIFVEGLSVDADGGYLRGEEGKEVVEQVQVESEGLQEARRKRVSLLAPGIGAVEIKDGEGGGEDGSFVQS